MTLSDIARPTEFCSLHTTVFTQLIGSAVRQHRRDRLNTDMFETVRMSVIHNCLTL